MRVSHDSSALSASFDEPNLVSCAGLVPVLALAERAGLAELVGQHLTLAGEGGADARCGWCARRCDRQSRDSPNTSYNGAR